MREMYSRLWDVGFLPPYKNAQGEYQFDGRFNQGVVTINLPQIALLALGDESLFLVFWINAST